MSDPTEGSPPPVVPAADPATQAAADVTRLLASAFGLRRAVQLAEQSRRDREGVATDPPTQPHRPTTRGT